MYPDEVYISATGYNANVAVYMYQVLVEKAASTKKADLRAVIARGEACINAPGGTMSIEPKSQHTTRHMRLLSVDANHSVRQVQDFGAVKPYWLGDVG